MAWCIQYVDNNIFMNKIGNKLLYNAAIFSTSLAFRGRWSANSCSCIAVEQQ